MDTSEMRELLRGYLGEMDMTAGLSKDDILGHLAGRDETLRTMVNAYLPEGSYQGVEVVMELIPEQAWQDSQGDEWRGVESLSQEDVDSGFRQSPMADEPVGATGEGEGSGASGSEAAGATESGMADLGVSGQDEIIDDL